MVNDKLAKVIRNTSTYVEKIIEQASQRCGTEKHLHIRGENLTPESTPNPLQETPPHTWRKYYPKSVEGVGLGNTSTYVEKIK